MDLSGKVVFITGAAQGLGKGFAEGLLEKGAKVFFGDVNAAAGSATFNELQARFGTKNVRFAAFDVTNHKQFEDAFKKAVSEFGHVDIMFNNAGILHEGDWERMIDTNFIAVVFGTKLATEHMRKDKGGRGGRIINMSSVTGLCDIPAVPVYCGTKHATRSYTSSLSLQPNIDELGIEYGIFCPEAVATDLILNLDHDKIQFCDIFKEKLLADSMPLLNVVDAFLELVQLERLNGSILLVGPTGNTYRKMENQTV